jgi:hypothetical protein
MQTNANFRLNENSNLRVSIGIDPPAAIITIEGKGAHRSLRGSRILEVPEHYIHIQGLTAERCDELAKQLKSVARHLRRDEKRRQAAAG